MVFETTRWPVEPKGTYSSKLCEGTHIGSLEDHIFNCSLHYLHWSKVIFHLLLAAIFRTAGKTEKVAWVTCYSRNACECLTVAGGGTRPQTYWRPRGHGGHTLNLPVGIFEMAKSRVSLPSRNASVQRLNPRPRCSSRCFKILRTRALCLWLQKEHAWRSCEVR